VPIQSLIDKRDTSEIVRDKIALILATESAAQQVLAIDAVPSKDPDDWKLRVFIERINPWEEFLAADDGDEALERAFPLVNVSLDSISYDMSASNVVERQKASAIFFVDVYGFGVATADGDGHTAGDQNAAVECQRALRLVRNILMAGTYTYLDMRGVVWKRWPSSVQALEIPIDARTVQQVAAMRLSLQVDFNEFAPQVEGQPLEVLSFTVNRARNDEVIQEYFAAQYGEES
jgi:hypothetical protein